tara:strand:- start:6818 stop:7063 length:246 start_codon:yes stop_codon:yes gene_type:complete
MNKLGLVVFYFLGVVDALVNFVSCLFMFYPKLELSIRWLLYMEGIRVNATSAETNASRLEQREEAIMKKEQAYTIDNGKDL